MGSRGSADARVTVDDAEGRRLWIGILGSLDVEDDHGPLPLRGPIPRRMLTALALAEGAAVADEEMVELVWPEPPQDVVGALRVTATRIRNALGSRHRGLIERGPLGYRLAIASGQIDSQVFTEAVERAERMLAEGDAEAAARQFSDALTLWRGQPWDELGDHSQLLAPRTKLGELRDVAFEQLQAARLAYGDAPGAVVALSAAVVESPYRERSWELLALGLYRTGRQAQALGELRRLRELFDTELGVEPGPALRDLEQRILQHDDALLTRVAESVGAATVKLPVALSAFVGRDGELATLTRLLRSERLVTVVGPPGVGKTRLALEFAAARDSAAGEQRWVVRLADVQAAADVAEAVAVHVGVGHSFGDPVVRLQRALAGRQALIVLDNCEHLVDQVREVIARLMPLLPELRMVATSRQPIGVDGECLLDLEPLPVTDGRGGDGDAVTLLRRRIKSALPRWEPTPDECATAREVCARLDGLPLAIELAAARVRSVGLTELARRLAEQMDVFGETPAGSVSPYATLGAAIASSVDALTEHDRSTLTKLWPFEGGFGWQAAHFVGPGHDEPASSVFAVLASLVDRSVVVADTRADPTRYRLLETIRAHCAAIDPDPAQSRERHAQWVRAFVAEQVPLLTGPRGGEAFGALAAELPNIRAQIAYDLEHHPIEALRTVSSLDWVWNNFGIATEGAALLRRTLDDCPDAQPADRANALVALSNNRYHASDPMGAAEAADAAIALLPAGLARGYARLQRTLAAGEIGDAETAFEQLAEYETDVAGLAVPPWMDCYAELCRGIACAAAGDVAGAADALERTAVLSGECGFLWAGGTALTALARFWLTAELEHPDPVRLAADAVLRAVAMLDMLGNERKLLSALYTGAQCLHSCGDVDGALQLRVGVLAHATRLGFDPDRYVVLAGGEHDDWLPSKRRGAAERTGAAMSFEALVPFLRKHLGTYAERTHGADVLALRNRVG